MVLDLLKFVKSAMKNFDQSEASIGSHMTRMVPEDVSKGPLGIPAKKISSCADTLLLPSVFCVVAAV